MDELKKYLREHRNELDVESPPRSEVWQRIQQQKTVHGKTVVRPVFRWVAAACMLLSVGLATYLWWDSKPSPEIVAERDPTEKQEKIPEIIGRSDTSEPAISPSPGEVIADSAGAGLAKSLKPVPAKPRKVVRPASSKERTLVDALEENYASIIKLQLKKLESTPIRVEGPGYFHAFKKQWYDMEKDEKKIKEDMQLYGLNDMVLTQFIQLYQQKLLLLKQLQEEINKMNNRAQQYPQMQTKSPSFLKM